MSRNNESGNDKNLYFFQQVAQFIDPNIAEKDLIYLTDGLTYSEVERGELLITPDRIHTKIKFIAKGLVRGYYIDPSGEEITTRILSEGGFATHYSAFLAQRSSDYYFEALEKTSILSFSFDYIQKGYAENPGLERFGRLVAEGIINILESRTRSFQFMGGEARYLQFLKEKGDLANRLSVTHLATYLGLTRPSLSRIRSQLSKK